MILHGYYRSTAAWRVRIVLGLKGLDAQAVPHQLRLGEHRAPEYLALNPQGLVPSLITDGGDVLTQSLSICEYLDEIAPNPPLLFGDAVQRARIRAAAQVVACDIHPVQNLRVLARLRGLGLAEDVVQAWARDTIDDGLAALNRLIAGQGERFCFGEQPTLADAFLVPQLGNARRFGVDIRWPRILAIEQACLELPAFADAVPARQADAE
ncbi:maleylacetoacetate isomerase [soil metagenome]